MSDIDPIEAVFARPRPAATPAAPPRERAKTEKPGAGRSTPEPERKARRPKEARRRGSRVVATPAPAANPLPAVGDAVDGADEGTGEHPSPRGLGRPLAAGILCGALEIWARLACQARYPHSFWIAPAGLVVAAGVALALVVATWSARRGGLVPLVAGLGLAVAVAAAEVAAPVGLAVAVVAVSLRHSSDAGDRTGG